MKIRALNHLDIEEASLLIERVSDAFSQKDFSEQGYKNFKEKVLYDGLRRNLDEGFMYWGGFESDRMIGLIAIKRPVHLFNLFVHAGHHGKGIATKLWKHVLSQLKPETVTVFSSTFALPLYLKLGFVQSDQKITNEEIICYPMVWKRKVGPLAK